jgi:N,N'-diacetyllegionaminate synthase
MQNIKKPYIIAETAFHHEGDEGFLIKLIEETEKHAVDALKFHVTVDLNAYMAHDHAAIKVLDPWCFKEDQWDRILAAVNQTDIVLLCNDVKSVEYAINCKFDVKAIEIHATALNEIFLLDKAAIFPGTVILGTGGSTLDEIDYAVQYLKKLGKHDIFLMHGFQNYPTDYKDIKLDRMKKLNQLFDLPVGYADHTDPSNALNEVLSCLGLANGFPVIEKHVTTHFGVKRIDAQSAISFDQLDKVAEIAQVIYQTLGAKDSLVLADAELKYGNTGPMKKAIVAQVDIEKGETIGLDKIAFKRTNGSSSIKQNELYKVLNNKANKAIREDEIIDLSNVDFEFIAQDTSQFKNTGK